MHVCVCTCACVWLCAHCGVCSVGIDVGVVVIDVGVCGFSQELYSTINLSGHDDNPVDGFGIVRDWSSGSGRVGCVSPCCVSVCSLVGVMSVHVSVSALEGTSDVRHCETQLLSLLVWHWCGSVARHNGRET